jgi:hypothetical protein
MITRRILLATVALGSLLVATPAQGQAWTLLAGYGGADYEGGLGPAYHLNLRREVAGWTDVGLGAAHERWRVPAVRLELDLLGQGGRSGTRVAPCRASDGACAVGVDPLFLLGAGVAAKAELTRAAGPLRVYYIPVSATAFLRRGEIVESKLGTPATVRDREVALAGGVGNGGGIQFSLAGVTAVAEVRAILTRDLDGRRGGALPVGVGFRW